MVRPPEPQDVPTDGESEPFRGTNPWSGPYLVLAIGGAVLAIVIGIIAAALWMGMA